MAFLHKYMLSTKTAEQVQAEIDALDIKSFMLTCCAYMHHAVQGDNVAFYEDGRQTPNGMHYHALAKRLAREMQIDDDTKPMETLSKEMIWRRANPGHNVVPIHDR